jgi:outer membrane protein assembly factor BamB
VHFRGAVITAVTAVIALGCEANLASGPARPPISNAGGTAPVVDHGPFVILGVLVAEDGSVVGKIAQLGPDDMALPDGPHRFRNGHVIIDRVTGAVTPEPVSFTSQASTSTIERRDPDGHLRWTKTFPGLRSIRPPDVALGPDRVIVAIRSAIHAFDDATGAPVWTANVHGNRLTVVGDTAYSTMCNVPTGDHWLIGIALVDGTRRFRAALPIGCDPWLATVNDWLIVVDQALRKTMVFDLAGKLAATFDEIAEGTAAQLYGGGFRVGDATLLVTEEHVLAIDRRGRVLWRRGHLENTFVGGNAFAALPGGDVVIANYGQINDSGVDVIRLHPDGSLVWRSCLAPLLVDHSAYQHLVYLDVRGDDLFVVSQGSYGGFLEQLSLATGARALRCVLDGGRTRCTRGDTACVRRVRVPTP